MTLAIEEAVLPVRQIPSDLLHPGFVGMDRATGEVNSSRLQFHHEQQVVRNEPAFGPHFDRCEVDGGEHIPMSLDKRGPAC